MESNHFHLLKKKDRLFSLDLKRFSLLLVVFSLFLLILFYQVAAVPSGPTLQVLTNETSTVSSAANVSISGGYIATLNITAKTQNTRWKAFVGNITGKLALDDATGSTIYDWSLTSIAGEIYTTRNTTTPTWTSIKCTNASLLETENRALNHTSAQDNITKTFNNGINGSHASFSIGSVTITANSCPTLNTYVGNVSQDSDFEEIALTDSTNFTAGGTIIYASILESDAVGFDNFTYDFQMIVPENGAPGFSGQTSYYLYVELS